MDLLKNLWRICKSDKSAFIGGVVILIYLGLRHLRPSLRPLERHPEPGERLFVTVVDAPPGHRLPGAGRVDRDRDRDPASARGRAPGGDVRGRRSGSSSGWLRATSEAG